MISLLMTALGATIAVLAIMSIIQVAALCRAMYKEYKK